MAKAISAGQAAPPVALRYLNRRCCETELNSGRADVVSFLSDVYASVAETLPDFRDDTYDCETTLEPATDAHGKDPYAELVAKSDPDAAGSSQGPLIGKAPKDKKKKQTRRSVQTNPGREPGSGELCERRWLPPGQMMDYYEMYKKRLRYSSKKPASFSTFWRVFWIDC